MNEVMRILEADDWDPDRGTLKRNGALRYREGVVADEKSVLNDPDIRFYAACNPGQVEGDSLACLCPLTARNIVWVFLNMLRRQRRSEQERGRGGLR